MDYKFCINDFEGPLDLLLHLVKTSKMDIYEIDIKIIIEEYLEILNNEKNKNIDIASSYLVMAAELIHLKSRMLINSKEEFPDDNNEFYLESEEDLREKIIEYEKYKKISSTLEEKRQKRSNFYTRTPENIDNILENKNYNYEVTIDDLVSALNKFKMREKLLKPLNTTITKKEYNIEDRIKDIRKILSIRENIEFLDLFTDLNRDFVIVTFLSILTMSKNSEITLTQENNFSPIIIKKGVVYE